ncbi:MAG: extracellular solute-binding protein [Gemmiger sp.]|nr:extracellular solute-binding protein [Gemmiger sp.]
MKKRWLATFLAATMACSLVGCGAAASQSGASTASAGTSTAGTAESKTSGEKVKLLYYGWTDEQSYLDPLFEKFNAQSEDSYIEGQYCAVDEYEEVVTSAMAAGTPIDVLAINGLPPMSNYQEKGYLADLTPYAEAAGFDAAATYGDIYTGANADGMYGLPYRMAVWLMYYNKDLLEELGIEYQTDKSYTWSEYKSLCETVQAAIVAAGKDIATDPNNACYAGLVGMNKNTTIAQRGVRLDDADASTAVREYWTLWNDLQADNTHLPYAEKLEYGTNVGSVYFLAGRVAFFQNATWGIASYNSKMESGEMPFTYGIMKMPVPDGEQDNTNLANPNFFGVPVTSKNPEQAYEFIQWACTEGGAQELASQSVLPAFASDAVTGAYTTATKQTDNVLGEIISSANNKLTDLCFPGYAEVQAAYEEQMESYLCGNATLEEAVSNFESKRDSILSK